MRYRLRTLMIFLTLASAYFAWVSHTRHLAALHHRKSIEAVERMFAAARDYREEEVEVTSEGLKAAEIRRMAEEAQSEKNSRLHKYHKAKASEYKNAIFTPWLLLIRR